MTKELEPCPFCGGEVERYNYMPGYVGGHGFQCKECDAQFLTGSDDDEATELFNTRYKRTCHIVIKPSDSDYRDDWHYLCSECGFPIEVGEREVFADGSTPIVLSHAAFCWHCGAEVVDGD